MNEMRRIAHLAALAACGAAAVLAAGPAQAQGRRAATLAALDAYPVFFHREEVVVVTDAASDGVLTWLVSEDDGVRILALDVPPPPDGVRERLEVVGTFYDVGRLEEGDPRLAEWPFDRLADELLRKPWPGVGELPVVIASSSRPAREPAAATLRSIVLEPHRYVDGGVRISGRFRGRNLYGDMPVAPDESRWDFVLRSADAAVWVVGKEPKGRDFELDVLARVDTSRWLEVAGTVRLAGGMVLIDAGTLTLATPDPDRAIPVTTDADPAPRPAPEVIFSAPLPDDINVPRDTTVRVQFSRDMDADSFDGQVRVRYQAPAEPPPDPADLDIPFEVAYRGRNRVLEIRFGVELESFRNVTVELLDGVLASDGARLPPWSLSFFVGS